MSRSLAAIIVLLGTMSLNGKLPDESNRMQDGHFPTPFSAKELKSHCPVGRTSTYQIIQSGKPTVFQTVEFTPRPEDKATFRQVLKTAAGDMIGEAVLAEATWEQLQSHASFESERTAVTEEWHTIEAGKFACYRYTVQGKEGVVSEFWFAKNLPGPPVHMVQKRGDEILMEMILMSDSTMKVVE